jgi:hypothetical protein
MRWALSALLFFACNDNQTTGCTDATRPTCGVGTSPLCMDNKWVCEGPGARYDLSQPLNGCNGLASCVIQCDQSNPAQSCYDDCDAAATQHALDLLKALDDCIHASCFQTLDADSGTPFCDAAKPDPTVDQSCVNCYSRVLDTGGACKPAENACTADKP